MIHAKPRRREDLVRAETRRRGGVALAAKPLKKLKPYSYVQVMEAEDACGTDFYLRAFAPPREQISINLRGFA